MYTTELSNNVASIEAPEDPALVAGLHVGDKSVRVARFHHETVKSFFEVLGAAGFMRPSELKPWYIMRRVSATEIRNYSEIYPAVEPGSLVGTTASGDLARAWQAASASRF